MRKFSWLWSLLAGKECADSLLSWHSSHLWVFIQSNEAVTFGKVTDSRWRCHLNRYLLLCTIYHTVIHREEEFLSVSSLSSRWLVERRFLWVISSFATTRATDNSLGHRSFRVIQPANQLQMRAVADAHPATEVQGRWWTCTWPSIGCLLDECGNDIVYKQWRPLLLENLTGIF